MKLLITAISYSPEHPSSCVQGSLYFASNQPHSSAFWSMFLNCWCLGDEIRKEFVSIESSTDTQFTRHFVYHRLLIWLLTSLFLAPTASDRRRRSQRKVLLIFRLRCTWKCFFRKTFTKCIYEVIRIEMLLQFFLLLPSPAILFFLASDDVFRKHIARKSSACNFLWCGKQRSDCETHTERLIKRRITLSSPPENEREDKELSFVAIESVE